MDNSPRGGGGKYKKVTQMEADDVAMNDDILDDIID